MPSGQSTIAENWWMDAAIRKNLLQNKASVILNVSDIFNTHKYTNTYDLPLYYQTVYHDKETRMVNLTFTWRFGQSESGMNSRKKAMQPNNPPAKSREENLKGDDSDNGGGGF
jgi:hypothetical protein